MTVIEHILDQVGVVWRNNPSSGQLAKVEPAVGDLYAKYVVAWTNQYGSKAMMPPVMAFLGLWDYCVKCLEFDKGSLVKDTRDDKYALVTGWSMRGYAATLIGVCADGMSREIEHNQFEPAEIPKEVVDIVRQGLIDKCPLMKGGCKEDE